LEFGAHLPLILAKDEPPPDAAWISDYAATAEALGYASVSSNDHVMYRAPWLDGPTTLAIAAAATRRVRIVTSILVPAIRHPFVAAKMLSTLDLMSGGRVIAGVGPGSYEPDYAATSVPFEERWKRLDQCVVAMRGIWQHDAAPPDAGPYAYPDVNMRPRPAQPDGPPIWIGSWGSAAGLRRVARLGDGWLASAYNTTPEKFGQDWQALQETLPRFDKQPDLFPNALVTMFSYIGDDDRSIDDAVSQKLAPAVGRTPEDLADRLLMGTPEECARRVRAYRDAGVQRIFIWPAADEIAQLRIFAERVMPLVAS
jgi:alkanesulfonate monooxygenase SsuD/methylene tetrahydromethanopterin reductase-like flavin-dependent oxidoreductase (luciferase family)